MYDLLFSRGRSGTHPAQPHRHDGGLRLPLPAGRHHDRGHAGLLRGPGQGGVGLIITEMVCVDEDRGVLFPGNSTPPGRRTSPPSAAWRTGPPHGTKIFAQLFHPGANADPKAEPLDLISASPARGRSGARPGPPPRRRSMPSPPSSARPPGGCRKRGLTGWRSTLNHHYFLHSSSAR